MKTIKRIMARILRDTDGLWRGQVLILFADGTHQGAEVTVDETAIREELAAQYMPEEGATSGFFKALGKWLSKTAKKISRWKVWKAIGNVVRKVVNSPIVAGIIGVASTIFPPLGATYMAAKSAVAVVDGLSRGDAKTVANIAKVGKAALAKNPVAAQVLDTVKAAEKSPLTAFIPAK